MERIVFTLVFLLSLPCFGRFWLIIFLPIFGWLLGWLSVTSPQKLEWGHRVRWKWWFLWDIFLFYDKSVWLKTTHFTISSVKLMISPQIYEFLCHATAEPVGEQGSWETVGDCRLPACVPPAWGLWGCSLLLECVWIQCSLLSCPQGSFLDPERNSDCEGQ